MTNMLPLKPYMFGHAAHIHKLVMDWRLLSGSQNDRKSGFKNEGHLHSHNLYPFNFLPFLFINLLINC